MAKPQYAKLARPRAEGLLARERLFQLLDSARARTIVWIAAPPGAGKTSLAATYLQARAVDTLWYQMDRGDDDPATFFHYARIAAQALQPRQSAPPTFSPEDAEDVKGFSRRFFRQVLSNPRHAQVVLLDNYQEVPETSAMHEAIALACDECPEGSNILVLSHMPPPGAFVRARASQKLAYIDWQQIRFNHAETVQLAQKEGDLPPQMLDSLHKATDGWPAGLLLMVERIRQTGQYDVLTSRDNLEDVFEYFATQVFATLSRTTQDLLMRMSYLPYLTPESASAVTGNADAVSLLDAQARRNLFVSRRHGESASYQIHSLYRSFLQQRAKTQFGVSEHRKALVTTASLLQATNQPEEAFPLYAEAAAWEGACRLILQEASGVVAQGRWKTLRAWIGALPVEWAESTPWLMYWHGMALLGPDAARGRDQLVRASTAFQNGSDCEGEILAVSNLLGSLLRSALDPRLRDPWLARLADLLKAPCCAISLESRAYAASIQLIALFRGNPLSDAIHAAALESERILDEEVLPDTALGLASGLLFYYWWMGFNDKGKRLLGHIDSRMLKPLAGTRARSQFEFARLHHLLSVGDFSELESVLACSNDLQDDSGLAPLESDIHVLRIAYLRAVGRNEVARDLLTEAIAPRIDRLRFENKAFYHSNSALLALQTGELDAAKFHVAQGFAVLEDFPLSLSHLYMTIVRVLVLTESGRFSDAQDVVASHTLVVRASHSEPFIFSLALAHSYLLILQGHMQAAKGILQEALIAARSNHLTNLLVVTRHQAAICCAKAIEWNIEREYVEKLIALRQWTPPHPDTESWPWPLRIEAFESFNLSVYRSKPQRSAKSRHRMLDLLKAIVCLGREGVSTDALIDLFWPDSDGDAGHNTLHVSLYRLRQMLDLGDLVRIQDGKVQLDRQRCWVDTWAFEDRLARWRMMSAEDSRFEEEGMSLLHLYRGHLMASEVQHPWMLVARERLRKAWLSVVNALGARFMGQSMHAKAVELFQRAIDLDQHNEELYRLCMQSLIAQGEHAAAMRTYDQLRDRLRDELGVTPSPRTTRLYDALSSRVQP